MIETLLALALAAEAPPPDAGALGRLLEALRPARTDAPPGARLADDTALNAAVRGLRVEARVAVRTAPVAPVASATTTAAPTPTESEAPLTPSVGPAEPARGRGATPTAIPASISTTAPPPPVATAAPTPTSATVKPPPPPPTRTVQRRLSPDGRLTVAFYRPDGAPEGPAVVHHVTALPLISLRRAADGRVIRVVADPSGAPVEVMLDPMGRFLGATLLDRARPADAR